MLNHVDILESIEAILTISEVFVPDVMENISLILNYCSNINFGNEMDENLAKLIKLLVAYTNDTVQANCFTSLTALLGHPDKKEDNEKLTSSIVKESKILAYSV